MKREDKHWGQINGRRWGRVFHQCHSKHAQKFHSCPLFSSLPRRQLHEQYFPPVMTDAFRSFAALTRALSEQSWSHSEFTVCRVLPKTFHCVTAAGPGSNHGSNHKPWPCHQAARERWCNDRSNWRTNVEKKKRKWCFIRPRTRRLGLHCPLAWNVSNDSQPSL